MHSEIKNLILDLFAIEAVQFGSFPLKSGVLSPIYVDMRLIISYPALMKKFSAALNKLTVPLSFDLLCGVPYGALPIATALSLERNCPMVFCRKEVKGYGTKKLLEGKFEPGQTCLLVEDVVTSGTSILETAALLRKLELEINDVVVIFDRQQGGPQKLRENSIAFHALITMDDLLQVLLAEKKISLETEKEVRDFLKK